MNPIPEDPSLSIEELRKAKRRERDRRYYAARRGDASFMARKREMTQRYRIENPERHKESQKRSAAKPENIERDKKRWREWRKKNIERERIRKREWYKKNIERERVRNRGWRKRRDAILASKTVTLPPEPLPRTPVPPESLPPTL